MPLFPIKIPPGLRRSGTRYQSGGRWFEANLVRWYGDTLRPFGGWKRMTDSVMDGPGRGLLTWRPTSYIRQAMIGTPNSLYVWDDDNLIDVTPTSLPAGIVDSFYGVGYGFGNYGEGPYGVSSGAAATQATTWSLDVWGAYAVACASHSGVIYEYINNALPAEPVANAPIANSIFVTQEGALVALGVNGDLRSLAWCSLRNNTLWTPDATNSAGDYLLQTEGVLVAGRRMRGTNLLWTTSDLWRMNFLGGVSVYGFTNAGRGCGLVAPLAVQVSDFGAMWMGRENFFRYDGTSVLPVLCDIHDFIFKDINLEQAQKFSSGQIAAFGEFLFFYCSADSTEINRCVSYNWREGHWNIVDLNGRMPRGCWADVGTFDHPMAGGVNGMLYEQESGWDDDGEVIIEDRFAMSGPIELGSGDRLLEANQLLPDEETFGGMQLHFIQQMAPEAPVTNRGPYEVVRPYVDVRLTARQVGIRMESISDEDFRFGTPRLNAILGGKR